MIDRSEPVFRDALFRTKQKKGGYGIVSLPEPSLEGPVADTHAHLDMLPDASVALARCAVHGVGFLCSIADVYEDADTAYDRMEEWENGALTMLPEIIRNSEELAEGTLDISSDVTVPRIRVAIGCHPHNARHYDDALESLLVDRLRDPRTSALGEAGLDYHYDFSPREVQRNVFRAQIRLAHECGLPLILHLREAHDDALAIMEEEGFPEAGVLLHCYNLDSDTLSPWLEHDCFVAFGGPLTFKKSEDTREAARKVPLNRLLTETDAPYMTPEPMRGMMCGPEHTIFTARKLAEIFACKPGGGRGTFLEQVFKNATALLDREPTSWQDA